MIYYVNPAELIAFQKFEKIFALQKDLNLSFSDSVPGLTNLYNVRTSFSAGLSSSHFGYGGSSHWKKSRAALAALGEAVERDAMMGTRPDVFERSFYDLKRQSTPALDVETYQVFSPDQPACREGDAFNPKRNTVLNWTWFEDATFGKGLRSDRIASRKVLIPSMMNDLYSAYRPRYFCPTTNGNGCGQDEASAKVSAVLELLERDAFAFYWWTRNKPKAIDLSQPNARLGRALRVFREFIPFVTLFLTKTDFDLTSVFVALRGDHIRRMPLFAVSGAAALDPLLAIEKALAEMEQLISSFRRAYNSFRPIKYELDFEKSIWDFRDHVQLYSYNDMRKAYSFLFPRDQELVHWADLKNFDCGTPTSNLEFIVQQFKDRKYRLYFRDLTKPGIRRAGLCAFRSFSPELLVVEGWHRFRAVGFSRLYTLPSSLGLKRRPTSFRDLNPYPHPFP